MKTLFQKMVDKNPERNPVFTAIDVLRTSEEIRTFAKQYEQDLLNSGEESIKGKEIETARKNIGYILGYYEKHVRDRWYGVLKDVSHPVFGRNY
jgi:hypothetical protein